MASVSWHEGNDYAPTVKIDVWQASQNIADNYSDVSYSLVISRPSNVGSTANKWYSVAINDSTVASGNTTIGGSGDKTIASGTTRVYHNSDGTKSISFSFSLDLKITFGGTYLGTASKSGTLALSTIPRASTITSISGGTLGQPLTINYSAASDSFSHKVLYRTEPTYWGYFYDISEDATYSSGSGWAKFTPGISDANYIPKATGTGKIRLETYSGSTLIGTYDKTFTLYVPDSVVPTIDYTNGTVDNSTNATIAEWGVCVAGYSKIKVEASASGSYSSTISRFEIFGTTHYGNPVSCTSGILTQSGYTVFQIDVFDSRGRRACSTYGIEVQPYSKPTISVLNVQRSSTNAQNIVVRANWNFADIHPKVTMQHKNNLNSATATLQYKLSTSSGWITYGTIDKDTEITLTDSDGNAMKFSEAKSYNFRLIVKDKVGNSVQKDSFISTIKAILDFKAGGKGLGIGKIAETDSMEVALDARFMGAVYIYDDSGNAMTLEEYIKYIVGSQ